LFQDLDALRAVWRVDRRFEPHMLADERAAHRARWREGLKRV
jgi:glycerol kinase